jgi:hypothetical protein
MSKIKLHIATAGPNGLRIWADPEKLSPFKPALDPADQEAPETISYSRGGGAVRQYPGDPSSFSRSGASVTMTRDVSGSNRSTPGKRFWIETPEGGAFGDARRVVQFTYQGTWTQLKAFFRTAPVGAFRLRNATGSFIEIAPAP